MLFVACSFRERAEFHALLLSFLDTTNPLHSTHLLPCGHSRPPSLVLAEESENSMLDPAQELLEALAAKR